MRFLNTSFFFALLISVLLSGCAVAPMFVGSAAFGGSMDIGKSVNFEYAKAIVPKSTTRSEVVKNMGNPGHSSKEGNTETLEYECHVHPGIFNNMKQEMTDGALEGDRTVVTVVLRGNLVVAVAGSKFVQETGVTDKFRKGETSLIPVYLGGGSASDMAPAAVAAEKAQEAASSTKGSSVDSVPPPSKKAAKKKAKPKPKLDQ